MKYIMIIFVFFVTSCDLLAQKVNEGIPMPTEAWNGFYDPVIENVKADGTDGKDLYDMIREYFKVTTEGIYFSQIGFDIVVKNDRCIGTPTPKDGTIYRLVEVLKNETDSFQGYFIDALDTKEKDRFFFAIEKTTAFGTGDGINMVMPRVLSEKEAADINGQIISKADSWQKYTFSTEKRPEEGINRPALDPDLDKRPFLEKIVYDGESYGVWQLNPGMPDFVKLILPFFGGMNVNSQIVFFADSVKKSDGSELLIKYDKNNDPATPKNGLSVWAFAYKNGPSTGEDPLYGIHYYPHNFKQAAYYFQGNNSILEYKNAYLPVMIAKDVLFNGCVHFRGKRISKSTWEYFDKYTLDYFVNNNVIGVRVPKSDAKRKLGFDPKDINPRELYEKLQKKNLAY
ncbi:MAG: hypothetical protein ACRCS8_05665 [Brevinema sp.]